MVFFLRPQRRRPAHDAERLNLDMAAIRLVPRDDALKDSEGFDSCGYDVVCDARKRRSRSFAHFLVVVHADHRDILRNIDVTMVAGRGHIGGDRVVGGEYADGARQIRNPVCKARQPLWNRKTAFGADICRDTVSVEAEDADEVPLALPAPLFVRVRRHVCVRGEIQRQQMMRGGLGHGLFVERDHRVAGVVRFAGAMEKYRRIRGKRLRWQVVVVDDAGVRTPERQQLRDFRRGADADIGAAGRESKFVVQRRQRRADWNIVRPGESQYCLHGG